MKHFDQQKKIRLLVLLPLLLLCVACAKKAEEQTATSTRSAAAANAGTMAYEHSVELETEREQVATVFNRLRDSCSSNSDWHCVVLEARVHGGEYASAHLKLRALPAAVQALMQAIPTQGEIKRQSTTAEDLAAPMADMEKRLQLLRDYQARLQTLQGHAGTDIDALMKISKELAQTQSDIESLSGERQYYQQRVDTELLNIDISSQYRRRFWAPVQASLREFGEHLSEAISALITATAYLLPWLFVGVVLVSVWRRQRNRRGRKKD